MRAWARIALIHTVFAEMIPIGVCGAIQNGVAACARASSAKCYWVYPDRLGDSQEFDDIDAALAALVLGDEGLRLFQPFGQVMLGETRLFARFDHQLAKGGLLGGVDGFAYAARARSHRPGRLIPSSDYPK